MIFNSTAEENIFQEILSTCNLVWIGEIHGIRENYLAYNTILPHLIRNGFKEIFWEMRSDFSEKSENSEDGRINPFSINLLRWLNDYAQFGEVEKFALFGDVKTEQNNNRDDNYEEGMAKQLVDIIDGGKNTKKSIVITGNYHMRSPSEKEEDTKPASDHVADKAELKILKIEIEYAGGTFYNYGVKKLPNRLSSTKTGNKKFGTITHRGNTFFFSVGEAHAVFKSPTTKQRSG